MKKAFSLIELMIVIVIIGVVYTLAITKLQNFNQDEVKPSLANLKEYLGSFIKDDIQTARLLCLDDCSDCFIYLDGKKEKILENFLDESVEVYKYDFIQGATQKKDDAFFNLEGVQESVCFSFKIGKDLVSEQVILSYKEKVYDYTNYFSPTLVYDSLDEAIQAKRNIAQEIMQ